MKTYKCFVLDAAFHIGERLSIDCANDEHAIRAAAGILERRTDMATIEVWTGTRLVQRVARAKQVSG